MLFNSLDFALFLPIVFFIFWYFGKTVRSQNSIVVVASYIFYGWWDWKFLSLILFSSIVDYIVAKQIVASSEPQKKKIFLWISLGCNLGILFFFKYYNFFWISFQDAFSFFGNSLSDSSLKIILPVGISFYTFQTLSYTIDVYRGNLKPSNSFLSFAAFVSFFPQLVAGPIERATNLLPQFYKKKKFEYAQAINGLRQILWGLFKKIVVADNAALIVNDIFDNSDSFSGSTLLIGAVFFAFQIYCDFSGYSDIAIGTSRLFGFNLKQNFAFPYFSRDIGEFWRRWHISLSTWFRDYVYIPLGGSRVGNVKKIRNVFVIFVVSGFWHGASWNFIVWGALHALYFMPLLLLGKNRSNTDMVSQGLLFPSFRDIRKIGGTFLLTVFAWIFFRADTIEHSFSIISQIGSASIFEIPHCNITANFIMQIALVTGFMLIIEWRARADQFALEKFAVNWSRRSRCVFYLFIVVLIFLFIGKDQDFIYFQF